MKKILLILAITNIVMWSGVIYQGYRNQQLKEEIARLLDPPLFTGEKIIDLNCVNVA